MQTITLQDLAGFDVSTLRNSNPVSFLIEFTPYSAKTFFGKYANPNNRKLQAANSRLWVSKFNNGEYDPFHPNQVAIVLVWIHSIGTWRLANGHNRFSGLIGSSVTSQEIVIQLRECTDVAAFNKLASKFDVQDGGKVRNIYDALMMDGYLLNVHSAIGRKVRPLSIQAQCSYNYAHAGTAFNIDMGIKYLERYEAQLEKLSKLYCEVKDNIEVNQCIVEWFFNTGKSEENSTSPSALKLQILIDILATGAKGEEFVKNLFYANSTMSYVTALHEHIKHEQKRLNARMSELARNNNGVATHNRNSCINKLTMHYLAQYWNRFNAGDTNIKAALIPNFESPIYFINMAEDRLALPYDKTETVQTSVQSDNLAAICATM